MTNAILLVPTGVGVGLTTVILGLSRALEEQGLRVRIFKPIDQHAPRNENKNVHSLNIHHVEERLSEGKKDELLEEILAHYNTLCADVDVVLIYGVIALQEQAYISSLNLDLANTLDAKVVIVTAPGGKTLDELSSQIEITARNFGANEKDRILGCVINKVSAPEGKDRTTRMDLSYLYQQPSARNEATDLNYSEAKVFKRIDLIASIPWNAEILAPRMKDILQYLDAKVVSAGEIVQRRVQYMTLYARSINNIIASLYPGTLIVTPSDRVDVIVAVCTAALSGIKIAGLLLTGGTTIEENTAKLCHQAMKSGLPILGVEENSFVTAVKLHRISAEIPEDDVERIEMVKNYVASYLDVKVLAELSTRHFEPHISPAAFRYKVVKMAQTANKKIVLPEGNEPRTIAAAAICAQRGLARCILLGKAEEIHRVAENNGISLEGNIIILDPDIIASKYVAPLVELRKSKGMTEVLAKEYLQDNVVLGTMMIQQGEVDGLVSGAVHTTANTIRPALQIIKTAPNSSLVSSVFFMCLPTQVLVFGDCAVNPNPDAEELAQIAIQSADTANAFGIPPRIAMISYSTGVSGSGADVEKVKQATDLVKRYRPDLIVDGPLQYDAAFDAEVANTKAPNSPVAGKATVFIFPDLNTGNTTYKAVQRSSDVLCIGPMLQGLRKPVNDLSRGATIDDIVYTIAITAVQAMV